MTEVEKRGIGKAKIGIAVSSVLAVILLISTIWLATRVIDLQRQVNTLHTEKGNLQTQVNTLTTQKTNLQNQVNDLQTKLNLGYSHDILSDQTVNQGASSRTLVSIYTCEYAGYVDVSLTSTTTNAYVEVAYSYRGQNFDFRETLGTSGWRYFCVLPTTVYIYVGNTNLFSGATHTVSVTYYY